MSQVMEIRQATASVCSEVEITLLKPESPPARPHVDRSAQTKIFCLPLPCVCEMAQVLTCQWRRPSDISRADTLISYRRRA